MFLDWEVFVLFLQLLLKGKNFIFLFLINLTPPFAFNVKRIHSYDVDPSCKAIAEMINDNWVCQSEVFRAHTLDCNLLLPTESDLIINTATEHFPSMTWWNNIPSGKRVVLQGNNMVHSGEEVTISTSLDNFKQRFPLSKYEYTGEIEFNYDTWGFTRYMVIGIK